MKKIIAIVAAALLFQGLLLGGGYWLFIRDNSYEPSEELETLRLIEQASSEYDSSFEDEGSIYMGSGDFLFVTLDEEYEEIGVLGNYQEEGTDYFFFLTYTYDEPMFNSGTRIYLENYTIVTPNGTSYYEAWGQSFEEDEYHEYDGTPEEFLELLNELEPRDYQTLLLQGGS